MHQYEITNKLIRYSSQTGLPKNEILTLIYLSANLNLTKYPSGTVKVTHKQIKDNIHLGRDAVSKGIKGLQDKGILSYVCTWQFLLKIHIDKVLSLFEEDQVDSQFRTEPVGTEVEEVATKSKNEYAPPDPAIKLRLERLSTSGYCQATYNSLVENSTHIGLSASTLKSNNDTPTIKACVKAIIDKGWSGMYGDLDRLNEVEHILYNHKHEQTSYEDLCEWEDQFDESCPCCGSYSGCDCIPF